MKPVTVRFVGSFRSIAGKNTLLVNELRGIKLEEFLSEVVARAPDLKPILVDPLRRGHGSNMLILVNGKEISVLSGLGTMIRNGDEVVLIPVVHGG